jgi:hypothetical protein
MNGDVYYQGGSFNYNGKAPMYNNQVYHYLDEPQARELEVGMQIRKLRHSSPDPKTISSVNLQNQNIQVFPVGDDEV